MKKSKQAKEVNKHSKLEGGIFIPFFLIWEKNFANIFVFVVFACSKFFISFLEVKKIVKADPR